MIGARLGIYASQNIEAAPLLLDDYPATAAYSLRKLRTAYSGAAIEVRIDTTGQPSYDIGFDSNGELDTADLLSKAGANDAYVTTWYDQSGNADNATQISAANQPQIVSSGSVNLENSNPTIDFDGINDGLIFSNTPLLTELSQFVVLKNNNISQDSVFLESGNNANETFTLGFGNLSVNPSIGSRARVGGSNTYIGKSVVGISQKQVSYFYNGISPSFYLDSIQEVDVVGARSSGIASSIGSRSDGLINFNGNIQEVIIYESDQSANRTDIETNINDYYNIYS